MSEPCRVGIAGGRPIIVVWGQGVNMIPMIDTPLVDVDSSRPLNYFFFRIYVDILRCAGQDDLIHDFQRISKLETRSRGISE